MQEMSDNLRTIFGQKEESKSAIIYGHNPIIGMDYPDADVIRVEDTYYMVSTTMYFMPGGVILRSYDLIHWEIASYVYHTLDDTAAQNLLGEQNIYGKGMWAASIRYHKGTFYICFVANDTHKTYLYTSNQIEGPWKKQYIEGFYHDCSLLFDDDDRVYIIYGNRQIHLTELREDLSGPLEGGINRIIVTDGSDTSLGYEGTHFYKINGRYYAFFIHSLADRWYRSQACYSSDSLLGEFVGQDVLVDDMGHRNAGIAQGGIVDTPDGKWYAILFQDRGAVGRIPVLVPMEWRNQMPVLGIEGKAPISIESVSTRPDYKYEPLYVSDDFNYEPNEEGMVTLHLAWQWNHNPQMDLWSVVERKGALRLKSGKLCRNLLEAYNTLTQRTAEIVSCAEVTLDGSGMKKGDYAGICVLLGCYAAIGLTYDEEGYSIVKFGKSVKDGALHQMDRNTNLSSPEIHERIYVDSKEVKFKVCVDFHDGVDEATFYYEKEQKWIPIGCPHKLYFRLDLFTGCRFGLYYYSTLEMGGHVDFMKFRYNILE